MQEQRKEEEGRKGFFKLRMKRFEIFQDRLEQHKTEILKCWLKN